MGKKPTKPKPALTPLQAERFALLREYGVPQTAIAKATGFHRTNVHAVLMDKWDNPAIKHEIANRVGRSVNDLFPRAEPVEAEPAAV
jgi:DNA invertase Pin-like site-specific DNA recombinase